MHIIYYLKILYTGIIFTVISVLKHIATVCFFNGLYFVCKLQFIFCVIILFVLKFEDYHFFWYLIENVNLNYKLKWFYIYKHKL